MSLRKLLSGIAVNIDDTFRKDDESRSDDILKIVNLIEKKLNIPCYKTPQIPSGEVCNNLLHSASFVLLDWQLWSIPDGDDISIGEQLIEAEIKKNIGFLEQAKKCFVPVFIFTNEDISDVKEKLPESLYREKNNFILIKSKSEIVSDSDFQSIEDWLQSSASVYTLKLWEQEFYKSKEALFGSMYNRSPDWPKIFWKAYKRMG